MPETCGQCHKEIAREFNESVHGVAVKAGVRDAPVCIDCHGEHLIMDPSNPASPLTAEHVSAQTCGRCHGDPRLAYANAGHNPPLWFTGTARANGWKVEGLVLGLAPNWQGQPGMVELAPGDRLVLFTDGITEATNAQGEEFQEERLLAMVTAHRRLRPAAIKETIMAALREFAGDKWNDDVTLLVLGIVDSEQ